MSTNDSKNSPEPDFLLFHPPQDQASREGVASGYQSLESAMLLVSMHRWPSVIPLMWGACENLIREHYSDHATHSASLQDQIKDDFPRLSETLHCRAGDLRRARNRLLHKGYSPRDNDDCIDLFFNVGIPYFEFLVQELVGARQIDTPAVPLWDIVADTRRVLESKLKRGDSPLSAAMFFLVGFIRFTFSPNLLTATLAAASEDWGHVLDDIEHGSRKELIDAIHDHKKGDGYCYEVPILSCPICPVGRPLLGASFSKTDSGFELKRIEVVGCSDCGYLIEDQDLIQAFFQDKLTREEIATLENENGPYVVS